MELPENLLFENSKCYADGLGELLNDQFQIRTNWQQFIRHGQTTPVIRPTVREAWERCQRRHLDPFYYHLNPLQPGALNHIYRQNEHWLSIARPFLDVLLVRALQGAQAYAIAITDREGVVMEFILEGIPDGSSLKGAYLAEKFAGNNSIGTALVTGRPVLTVGAEHYNKFFHPWTGVGIPIHNANRQIIGCLGVAVLNHDAHQHLLPMTVAIAKTIEAKIFEESYKSSLVSSLHSLELLQKQYNFVLDAMETAVIVVDKDYKITVFNRGAEEVFLARALDVIGRNIAEAFPDLDENQMLCRQTLLTGVEIKNEELILNYKNRNLTLLVNSNLIRNRYNQVMGVIILFNDLTEKRLQEKTIRDQEKLAALGQMAAGMAHELRNPLTSVRGFIQLLAEKAKINEPVNLDYMNIIIAEIDRTSAIIRDFLQFARPKPLNLAAKPINEVIMEISPLIVSQAIYLGIDFQLELDPVLPVVLIDPDQIKQVIINCVQNSFQAMTGKGVLTIGTTRNDREVLLMISDTGAGIPAENLTRIGTPFFTTKDEGTGLGLSIAYRIIHDHRGRIEITSNLGEKTIFTIYLPMVTD